MMNRLLPALLITGLLVACGQKGALYLPPPATTAIPAPVPTAGQTPAPAAASANLAPAQSSAPASP